MAPLSRCLSWTVLALALAGSSITVAQQRVITVNCSQGERIERALRNAQEGTIIQVVGICTEDVVVRTDGITLRGSDPLQDGIRGVNPAPPPAFGVVMVDARAVRLENLSILDGLGSGLLPYNARQTTVTNCRFVNNRRDGVGAAGDSFGTITDTVFQNNGRSGLAGFGSDLFQCIRCSISGSQRALLGVRGAVLVVFDSDLSASDAAIEAMEDATIDIARSTISAPGLSVRATRGSRIAMTNSSVMGSFSVDGQSQLTLASTTQTGTSTQSIADTGSMIRLDGTTTVSDTLRLHGFSALIATPASRVQGSLVCNTGGNASCTDPAAQVSGTSNCGLCSKP